MQKRLQVWFYYANITRIFIRETRRAIMPNIKSAKKRVVTSEKRNKINVAKKSRVKNAVKKFNEAVQAGDVALAEKLLPETMSVIDCAFKDGIFKKNTAARKKATLCRALDKLKAAK